MTPVIPQLGAQALRRQALRGLTWKGKYSKMVGRGGIFFTRNDMRSEIDEYNKRGCAAFVFPVDL